MLQLPLFCRVKNAPRYGLGRFLILNVWRFKITIENEKRDGDISSRLVAFFSISEKGHFLLDSTL